MQSVRLKVLTTDSAGPALSQRVRPDSNPAVYPNGYEVHFTRRIWGTAVSPGQLALLPNMFRWADVVHLTGTYSFPTLPTLLLARLFSKPLVWSPRGALQAAREWSEVRSKTPKRLFEKLCNVLVRPDRVVLHVTSEEERRSSEAAISVASSVVIPNGVDIPETLLRKKSSLDGRLRIMFIGRLDPKKGLEILLDAIRNLTDPTITVDVYGTGDPEYVARLQALVEKYRLGAYVHLLGHVSGEDKARAFADADVCVLPSYSENFGMVIAESLAHGVPVITSKMTPWRSVESIDCGLWIENSADALAEAIKRIRSRDLAAMGARGREWIKREFSWLTIAGQISAVYDRLLTNQPPSSHFRI